MCNWNPKRRMERIGQKQYLKKMVAENLPKLTLNHNSKCARNSKYDK